jgi:hypothetical protein
MKPAWIEFPPARAGDRPVKCAVVILSAGKGRSQIRYVADCETANAGDERSAPNHILSDREDNTVMTKPYARIPFDEAQFKLTLSCYKDARQKCFDKWTASSAAKVDAKEESFYKERVAEYDALIKQFEDVLVADTSQDADETEDEEDEDEK